jgi:hypothetical protein
MKLSRFLHRCVVVLTCSGMMSAQFVRASDAGSVQTAIQTPVAQTKIQDVALRDQGVLLGTVLDEKGNARGAVPVAISRQGNVIARTETNASGQFAVQGLSGGLHEVQTPVGSGVYRFWAPRTAPPAASAIAMVAPNTTVVRGQMGLGNGGGGFGWLANPWVLAGVVAAAIAIPLALDDDDAS